MMNKNPKGSNIYAYYTAVDETGDCLNECTNLYDIIMAAVKLWKQTSFYGPSWCMEYVCLWSPQFW